MVYPLLYHKFYLRLHHPYTSQIDKCNQVDPSIVVSLFSHKLREEAKVYGYKILIMIKLLRSKDK